ncbi:MAG: hypothetical protein BGO98_15825 [Myxococcales bacterium 68-20]|nr:MAG: hypothetical protein BGO98_15825 [Myxococcales bacterium 68-20]
MSKLSHESVSLIEAARVEFGPTSSDRHRLREQILARVAAPAPATETAGGAPAAPEVAPASERPTEPPVSGIFRSHALKLIGASALVVAAIVTTQHASTSSVATTNGDTARAASMNEPQRADETTPAPEVVHAPAPALSPNHLPDAPVATDEVRPRANLIATTRTPSAPPPVDRGARPTALPEPVSEVQTDALGVEMRILREAHAALKSGELARARASLDQHARSYPRGILREERLALSAIVFCAEGRRDEARRSAEDLARETPRSSHLERLRGSCAADALLAPARTTN